MVSKVANRGGPPRAGRMPNSGPLLRGLVQLERALAQPSRAGGCLPWSRGPDRKLLACIRSLTSLVQPLLGNASYDLRQRVYVALQRLEDHLDGGHGAFTAATGDLKQAVCRSDDRLAKELVAHLTFAEDPNAGDVLEQQRQIIKQLSVDSPSRAAQHKALTIPLPRARPGGGKTPGLPPAEAVITVHAALTRHGADGVASRRKMAPHERALVVAKLREQPTTVQDDVRVAIRSERGLTSKWLQGERGQIYHVANRFTKGTFGKGRRALNEAGEPCFIKEVRLDEDMRLDADLYKPGVDGEGYKTLATQFTSVQDWNEELRLLVDAGARFKPVDEIRVDGKAYAVFQELDGSLGDIYKKFETPEQRRALAHYVGYEVACDQERAHAAGILHRDVKPDNILVGRNGDLGLSDYGFALRLPPGEEALHTEAGAGRFSGTKSYAAPEVNLAGRPHKASDVYSLGCVILRVLAGSKAEHLFAGMRPSASSSRDSFDLWAFGHKGWENDFQELIRRAPDGSLSVATLPQTQLYANFPQVRLAYTVDPDLTAFVVFFMLHPQASKRWSAAQVAKLLKDVAGRPDLHALAIRQMGEHLQPSATQRGTSAWLRAQYALTQIVDR